MSFMRQTKTIYLPLCSRSCSWLWTFDAFIMAEVISFHLFSVSPDVYSLRDAKGLKIFKTREKLLRVSFVIISKTKRFRHRKFKNCFFEESKEA